MVVVVVLVVVIIVVIIVAVVVIKVVIIVTVVIVAAVAAVMLGIRSTWDAVNSTLLGLKRDSHCKRFAIPAEADERLRGLEARGLSEAESMKINRL